MEELEEHLKTVGNSSMLNASPPIINLAHQKPSRIVLSSALSKKKQRSEAVQGSGSVDRDTLKDRDNKILEMEQSWMQGNRSMLTSNLSLIDSSALLHTDVFRLESRHRLTRQAVGAYKLQNIRKGS